MAMRNLRVQVSREEYGHLLQIAKHRGMTVSGLVRSWTRQALVEAGLMKEAPPPSMNRADVKWFWYEPGRNKSRKLLRAHLVCRLGSTLVGACGLTIPDTGAPRSLAIPMKGGSCKRCLRSYPMTRAMPQAQSAHGRG